MTEDQATKVLLTALTMHLKHDHEGEQEPVIIEHF